MTAIDTVSGCPVPLVPTQSPPVPSHPSLLQTCLIDLLLCCPTLETLVISWLVLDESAFAAIAQHGANLRKLDVSGSKAYMKNTGG